MPYSRREVEDFKTVINKELYDNLQDGVDESKEAISTTDTRVDEVEDKADEALIIAKGKNRAKVFQTTEEMQVWLSTYDNRNTLLVGDNLLIIEVDVPDWWVTEVLSTPDPDTSYYYKIAQLETQKVSLGDIERELSDLDRTMKDHSSQHSIDGSDPITPTEIGAVSANQTDMYNFTNKGIDSVNIDNEYNYNYVVAISKDGNGTRPSTGLVNVMNIHSTHFTTQIAVSCANSAVPNRSVGLWVRERYSATGVWSAWKRFSPITISSVDLVAGVSPLPDGELYFVYK